MTPIKVFWIEPTTTVACWLRRYRSGPCSAQGNHEYSYHNAMRRIEDAAAIIDANGYLDVQPILPRDDPRWPPACECGYVFDEGDNWQLFQDSIYRRPDTGDIFPLREAPVGACWDAFWISRRRKKGFMIGPDGRSLMVRLPGNHDWLIDGRCNNCTMPNDDEHKCWVRHGKPEDGTLHVDKNGVTCAAGGGSIDTGKWHGFLHNGFLTA